MQKLFSTKPLLLLGLLVFVFSFALSLSSPSASAWPDLSSISGGDDSASKAATFCKQYSGRAKDSCLLGYKAGGKKGSNPCSGRTVDPAPCAKGYQAGKGGGGGGGGGDPDPGGGGGGGGGGDPDSGGGGTSSSSSAGTTDPLPEYDEHVDCTDKGVTCEDPAASKSCDNNGCDLVGKYINPAITALSFLVGIAAAASIIFGGIQYSASNGDPQKITQAKDRIVKTIIAFICYLFLFSFLQFIVPGGVFH